MAVPDVKEKTSGKVNEVTIGATSEEGGTRAKTVTVGGETSSHMLSFEGEYPNPPAMALEIVNGSIEDWPAETKKHVEDVADDLGAWAARCEEWGADLICLSLTAASPSGEGKSPDECAADVKAVLQATGLPLIVWGCDEAEVDAKVLPTCSQAAAGENCLLGTATEDNYRTIGASCLADGHKVLAEAPSDINLSKQLHILLKDVGVSLEDIVMHPTAGALGFGMIYIYTTIERGRIAGLDGDKQLQQPVIVNMGREIGRVKKACQPQEEAPEWGPESVRTPLWEAQTVLSYLECGAELFVMRNPEALKQAREFAADVWPAGN
jgi:acetyl-CoA decarbonylase/synthase complex subunit delta